MVILKVGHHLYDGHHLFGTKQQQTLEPSREEQYHGFGSARWTAWWSMTCHRDAWRCLLRRCGLFVSLGRTVRDPTAGAGLLCMLCGRSTL
jgi:hypothetical protein